MRNYIYINNDLVSSYLAQNSSYGIIETSNLSEESGTENSKGKSIQGESTGSSLGTDNQFVTYIKNKTSGIETVSSDVVNVESSKREISFKSHMINNFGKFYDEFKNEIQTVECTFDLFDLDNIRHVAKFTLIDNFQYFMKQNKEKEYSAKMEAFNREQRRQERLPKLKEYLESEKDGLNLAILAMDMLRLILPSSVYLENDDYIIPLDAKYLLYDLKLISYLIKDNTVVVGIEGPVISDVGGDNSESENLIKNLKSSFSTVYGDILNSMGIDSNKKLLIPIAWYQEQ